MLFQPYHSVLTAGRIREYLKDYPDHAPVRLDGGDDWSDGHELYATKPKELYMPSQDSLSRRIGPAFAAAAVDAALDGLDKPGYPAGWGTSPRHAPTAANYKPVHGGYPGTPKLRNPQPFC